MMSILRDTQKSGVRGTTEVVSLPEQVLEGIGGTAILGGVGVVEADHKVEERTVSIRDLHSSKKSRCVINRKRIHQESTNSTS